MFVPRKVQIFWKKKCFQYLQSHTTGLHCFQLNKGKRVHVEQAPKWRVKQKTRLSEHSFNLGTMRLWILNSSKCDLIHIMATQNATTCTSQIKGKQKICKDYQEGDRSSSWDFWKSCSLFITIDCDPDDWHRLVGTNSKPCRVYGNSNEQAQTSIPRQAF